MRKFFRMSVFLVILFTIGCEDKEGVYKDYGTATFWIKDFDGNGNPTVTVNGLSAQIGQTHSTEPACGTVGAANFSLPAGTYAWSATNNGEFWQGDITVPLSGCVAQELVPNVGSGTGEATFWIQSDLSCGYITVVIASTSGQISSYYNSTPSCGSAGCANFTLPVGEYYWTASCSLYNWDSYITITEDECSTMRLYVSKTEARPASSRSDLHAFECLGNLKGNNR